MQHLLSEDAYLWRDMIAVLVQQEIIPALIVDTGIPRLGGAALQHADVATGKRIVERNLWCEAGQIFTPPG